MPTATPETEDRHGERHSTEHQNSNNRTPAEKTGDTTAAPWRALLFFTTKANLPILITAIATSIVTGAIAPAQAYLSGRILDGFTSYAAGSLEKDEFMDRERKNVCYLLIIAGASWLFNFIDLALWIAFGELQAKSVRDRLFKGLLNKSIEWYDLRKNGIGALLPRLHSRTRELQLATSQPLGTTFSATSTAMSSMTLALVLSWKLTLVIISTVPLILLAVAWVGRGVQKGFEQQENKLSEAQKHATSALSAIETVKCFNAQEIEHGKYMKAVHQAARWYYRAASANAAQVALIALLSVSMFVQGFYYGAVLVAKGETSTATVVTTFLSAIAAFQSINAVLPQLIVLERGRAAGSSLRAVMAEVHQRRPAIDGRRWLSPAQCRGEIKIKNLTFAYPTRLEQPAIQDVSMTIPAGEITFVIGKSGSGKSTIAQLLLGFYSSYDDEIRIDGMDLTWLDPRSLRECVTLVEQSSVLFNDTIFRNIAFGKQINEEATDNQIWDAVEFALLQSTMNNMPDGLETQVGFNGTALSGGQKQRVALARARLRDTPVLLLDECTSALDGITRSLMMDAIRQWRRGKTTVIITHDVAQISPNDYVFVMEHGKLAEAGYRRRLESLTWAPLESLTSPTKLRASTVPLETTENALSSSVDARTNAAGLNTHEAQSREDPLERHLRETAKKRRTIISTAFGDSNTMPTWRAQSKASVSPWSRQATFFGNDIEIESEPIPPPKWATNEALDDFIARTGELAARSRLQSSHHQSQRSDKYAQKSKTPGDERPSEAPNTGDLKDAVLPNVARARSMWSILSTIWPNIGYFARIMLILGFWSATVHAVSSPVFAFMLSKLLQLYSIQGGNSRKALTYSMIMLAVAIVNAIHTYLFNFLLEYVGQHWIDSIRNKAIRQILNQPRVFFDTHENAVSRLTSCLDQSAEEMRTLLRRFLAFLWIAITMSLLSLTWALLTQWKMTLIALAAAPYFLGVTKAYAMISERWEHKSNAAAEDAVVAFAETFTNIKTVRALTLEQEFRRKYVKITNRVLVVGFQRAFFAGFFCGISDSASSLSIAMMFYVGARLVSSGASVHDIVQVFILLLFTINNIETILAYIPQIGASKDSAARLLSLAKLPKNSHEHSGDANIAAVGDIIFDDLQFAYTSRPGQSILKHFILHIKPGTCTAIVGASGSGKSTIGSLLLKLYSTATAPSKSYKQIGDLIVAGRDIKRVHTASLRSLIVPVPQSPIIFPTTAYENVTYGLSTDSPYNNPASVAAAAQQAGIHSFINSLAQGYSTTIGEGGAGLSGGQAQRIAIARALVRKPAVLILDEATSALDVESASVIRHTIKRLVDVQDQAGGVTVIIITHSREMMESAENVVVLDQGRVVEEGSFVELSSRSGALSHLLSGGEWTDDREVERPYDLENTPALRDVDWRCKRSSRSSRRTARSSCASTVKH